MVLNNAVEHNSLFVSLDRLLLSCGTVDGREHLNSVYLLLFATERTSASHAFSHLIQQCHMCTDDMETYTRRIENTKFQISVISLE